MTAKSLDQVTVLGAGVLGGQIAWQSAFSGKTVVVYDLYQAALDQCIAAQQTYAHIYKQDLNATEQMLSDTRARISFTDNLAFSVAEADLVIEAVPEIPQVKVEVYEELAGCLPPHTLLVTNSSTLLPGQFAEFTGRPEKYCALHFANLIWALNIAEVMAHSGTSVDTLEAITRFAIEIGMVPIPIQKEQKWVRAEHHDGSAGERRTDPGDHRRCHAGNYRSNLHDYESWLRHGALWSD